MSCDAYGNCIKQKREQLRYPLDTNSLYAERIYDNQTANKRCYTNFPINILEGFGTSWGGLIKLVVIILLIILLVSFFVDYSKPKEVIQLGLGSPSIVELSQITNFQ
jgi:hypothetical protein